jgi:hypothetical protein
LATSFPAQHGELLGRLEKCVAQHRRVGQTAASGKSGSAVAMLDCYSHWRTKELTARSLSQDLETANWSSNSWQVLTVIAVLGFVFSLVLDEIERMLIPWKANA